MIPSLLASSGLLEDLGINPVVLATQVVIFIITFVLLSRILFGRTLDHMQRREEEIRSAQAAIQHSRAEVERMTKDYEAQLAKVDKEAYDRTQAILKDALSAAQASIGKAQADAKAESQRAVAEIARDKASSLVQLRSEVARLTLSVAEKVMDTRLEASAQSVVQKYLQERK